MLDKASLSLLRKCHPDLAKVIVRAEELAPGTFKVTETARTRERQAQLYKRGATRTMKSRHIPETSKANPAFAHAVDIVCLVDGKGRYDWPLFPRAAAVVKRAAKELKIPVEWGGDWPRFKDGPHFQLPWGTYP